MRVIGVLGVLALTIHLAGCQTAINPNASPVTATPRVVPAITPARPASPAVRTAPAVQATASPRPVTASPIPTTTSVRPAPATASATPSATASATPSATATATPSSDAGRSTISASPRPVAAPATTSPSPSPTVTPSQTLPAPATAKIVLNGTYLTTKDQANGPTIMVDETGREVVVKGIGWYGFNVGGTAPLDMTKGVNALSQDLDMIIYRMKMLGFNSIRLPLSFDNVWGLGQAPPIPLTRKCVVPSTQQIEASLVPPAFPSLPLAKSNEVPQSPPEVVGSICNTNMPEDSTLARFVWIVQRFIEQGFYVNVDYHSNKHTDEIAHGDGSIYNQEAWTATWVQLIETILRNTPSAQGKLLLDLVNEPDGFGLMWNDDEAKDPAYPSLTDLYVKTIDALYPICPGCIFLVEGTGQYNYCGVNWGNGFATDPAVVKQHRISDATPFFTTIMSKPWLEQVVLAPHFYCPGVSEATDCYSGKKQWLAYDDTVGYLTRSPGYCKGGTCKIFPAVLDEFGSYLNSTVEIECMRSIIQYINVGKTGNHAPLTSWYYWAWQPDSNGTGGMVEDDWTTIRWDKVDSLTGGTKDWPEGAGLAPWYLASFNETAPTFDSSGMNLEEGVTISTAGPSGPPLPAAATPSGGPTVEQWLASAQASNSNGVPAPMAAMGSLLVAALVASAALILV